MTLHVCSSRMEFEKRELSEKTSVSFGVAVGITKCMDNAAKIEGVAGW